MVQRASGEFNLPAQNTPVLSQSSGGLISPNVQAERVMQPDRAVKDNTLHMILGTVDKLGQQALSTSQEEAYLQGASKVGQIESEAELEGNFITRDWAVAGYRDTTGKLKVADAEANLKTDMLTLREQSPEKMQEYLAKRRADLVPTLEGMSREQRKSTFGQLLLNDRAAIATHTAEYTKFQIEARTKAQVAGWTAKKALMEDAQQAGEPGAYTKTVESAVGHIHGVLTDAAIPPTQRVKLVTEMVQDALTTNNVNLYKYLRDNVMPGDTDTVLSQLPMDDQIKMSKANEAAMKATEGKRDMLGMEQYAGYKAAMQNGTYNLSYKEAEAFASGRVQAGTWTAEGKYAQFLTEHLEYGSKHKNVGDVTNAFARGDKDMLLRSDTSEEQALALVQKQWSAEGLTSTQRFAKLTSAGINGMGTAFKAAGDIAGIAVMQLGKADGEMLPQHAEVLQQVNQVLDYAKAEGKSSVQPLVLSGMTPAAQTRLLTMRALMADKYTPELALKEVLRREALEQGMSPAQRAALNGASTKELYTLVHASNFGEGEGAIRWVGRKVTGIFSTEAENQTALAPSTSIFDWGNNHPNVISAYKAAAREDLMAEAMVINQTSTLDAAGQFELAQARVVARTVQTTSGPLRVPMGKTPQEYFGTNADNGTLGKAIDMTFNRTVQDGRMTYSTSEGGVYFQEYNDKGEKTPYSGTVDPKEVGKAVQAIRNNKIQAYQESHGKGKNYTNTRPITQGKSKVATPQASVQYNGDNTASVSNEVMLSIRDNLVKNEGVRNRVYKDTLGNDTVGVGITNKRYWPKVQPDGTVLQEDINSSFFKASSEAAYAGVKVQAALKLKGDDWTKLLSEVAYQSGTGFVAIPEYREFLKGAKLGDPTASVQSFRETPAWKVSSPARRAHYESLITKAMKG